MEPCQPKTSPTLDAPRPSSPPMTRAIDSDEGAPGPIYLQGDHGEIHYRKITITPAKPMKKREGS